MFDGRHAFAVSTSVLGGRRTDDTFAPPQKTLSTFVKRDISSLPVLSSSNPRHLFTLRPRKGYHE